MKYYRFDTLPSDTIYCACDAEGLAIDVLYGDRSEEFGYRSVSTVERGEIEIASLRDLRDSMYCPSSYLLLSERLHAAIESLAIDSAIASLPLSVTGGMSSAQYYMLHSSEARDPFDYEQASFEYFPGRPRAIMCVKDYVFDPDKIPPYALFRTKQYDWIVNESLAILLRETAFTGFELKEIWRDDSPSDY